MIDLSTMQSLSIPEGAVSQIEAGGRVIWCSNGKSKIVLEVRMMNEDIDGIPSRFFYLSVRAAIGEEITLTYGSVSKKIIGDRLFHTVYFGYIPEKCDDVDLPDSGVLTIEGPCINFTSEEDPSVETSNKCICITKIVNLGSVDSIPSEAFYWNKYIQEVRIPSTVRIIGKFAFCYATSLKTVILPQNPPFLNHTNAFSHNHPDIKFYVPSVSSYTAYLNATNWSSFAGSFLIGEPPEEV